MKAKLFNGRRRPRVRAGRVTVRARGRDDGTVLAAHGETIGVATNNVAEYRALVAGLEKAR